MLIIIWNDEIPLEKDAQGHMDEKIILLRGVTPTGTIRILPNVLI